MSFKSAIGLASRPAFLLRMNIKRIKRINTEGQESGSARDLTRAG
jgi:hypothetical protein